MPSKNTIKSWFDEWEKEKSPKTVAKPAEKKPVVAAEKKK